MNFKRLFYITFILLLTILFAIASFVVIVDPYQQYRKSNVFFENQRLENPGVAMHHDYDAVIVGSSMAMNHYPSQIDSLFGWNTINLTTMGGTDYDYCLLFPHIINQGKARHFIWGMDFFSFSLPQTNFLSETYLYDNVMWNDYPYWLSYTSLENTIKKVRNHKAVSRDSLYHFSSSVGQEHLLKYYQRDNNLEYFKNYDFSYMKQRFDTMLGVLMPLMADVDLYIYFPPYSILEFRMFHDYGHWPQIKDCKRHMIERMLQYPNVRLYDFQREEFICNMDEFMDLRHHSHNYNKRIIESIAKGQCRVTYDNYEQHLQSLDSLVINFSLNEKQCH